jgi:hypothetical protein
MSRDSLAPAEKTVPIVYHRRDRCRICDGNRLEQFLSLGPMPLANAFLRSSEEFVAEPHYPLDVSFCPDCSHVQLLDVIDSGTLFSEYLYVTGTSESMVAHNRRHAALLVEELKLTPNDLVIEVGSNDGSLLRSFQNEGMRTLGIEPAANIARMARDLGVETLTQFFDEAAAEGIAGTHGRARVVIGKNVLAHVDDPRDFLRGCRTLMDPSGVTVIEVPYLGDLLDKLEYDTVYHEHLSYFSMMALRRLCDSVGLTIQRVERLGVHGGSLRLTFQSSAARGNHCDAALAMIASERSRGLGEPGRYFQFAGEVARNRDALLSSLEGLAKEGRSIAAYGAPAKGNTLLNYCRIDTTLVEFTVDRNPLKIGLFTPGAHLPVYPVEALLERRPDFALLLAWNLADEILGQQQEYLGAGGRFMVPIPAPRLL